jgi:hypothetical protein
MADQGRRGAPGPERGREAGEAATGLPAPRGASTPLSEDERAELDRLRRAELDRLRGPQPGGPRRTDGAARWRWPLAVLLVVLGCLLAPLAVVAAWTHTELSDTDRYVETVAPLARDPAVQDAIATRVTAEIFDRLDVDAISRQAVNAVLADTDVPPVLADRLRALVSTMARSLQDLVRNQIRSLVRTDEFATLWVRANRVTHQALVGALSGREGGALTIDGTAVRLNLGPVLEEAKERLAARGFTLAEEIPAVNPSVVVFEGDDVAKLQPAYGLLERLSIALPVAAAGCLAAGVLVAPRRRRTLVGAGVGVIVAMALAGLGLVIARTMYLGSLPPGGLPPDAAAAIFDTLVRFLREQLWMLAAVGLVVAVGAILVGPASAAVRVRSWAVAGIGWLRARAESVGLRLGRTGSFVAAHATALRAVAVVLAVIALVVWVRPTVAVVALLTGLVLVALAVVEFLARPEAPAATPAGERPSSGQGGQAGKGHPEG